MEGNRSILDLDYQDLEKVLMSAGVKAHHAKALWATIQRQGVTDLSDVDFLPPLAAWVAESVGPGKDYFIERPEQVEEIHSSDGLTRKYLLRLDDGQVIETVLMEYEGRFTACLSRRRVARWAAYSALPARWVL